MANPFGRLMGEIELPEWVQIGEDRQPQPAGQGPLSSLLKKRMGGAQQTDAGPEGMAAGKEMAAGGGASL